jgi:hypothetical protein
MVKVVMIRGRDGVVYANYLFRLGLEFQTFVLAVDQN